MSDDTNKMVKVVVIGDTSVGKSNLLTRFCNDQFFENSQPTIGTNFLSKTFELNGMKVKAQFWDTAGQEKYRSLTSSYYKNANGIIFVYDITNEKSFKDLNYWINDVQENANIKPQLLLIGNKIDLVQQRVIKIEQGEKFAKDNDMKFMECSALSNENNCVKKAFEILIIEILEQSTIFNTNNQDNLSEVNSLIEKRKEKQILEEKKCCQFSYNYLISISTYH